MSYAVNHQVWKIILYVCIIIFALNIKYIEKKWKRIFYITLIFIRLNYLYFIKIINFYFTKIPRSINFEAIYFYVKKNRKMCIRIYSYFQTILTIRQKLNEDKKRRLYFKYTEYVSTLQEYRG